jgi:hypothetical protein
MICKISNFDKFFGEIHKKFQGHEIEKKMVDWFILKCVNVCNMQIVQPINFPQLPMCCTHYS